MLATKKLKSIELLASKALFDWYVGQDEFVSIIKYEGLKEKTKNMKTSAVNKRF